MSIRQLSPQVVQQIAAGEVIVSPRNALKELLENALDAGATLIEVQVADNGFGMLQVKDNGSGIDEKDLELLCTRFATSKLSNYEDLTRVATLGFRGEALSSISHVSHLSVTTKKRGDKVALKAKYSAGKLEKIDKTAGLDGTTISVESLFYNNPTRRKALGSGRSEYGAIMDTVMRYAIRYPGTFTCKQTGDVQPTVVPDGPTKNKIQSVFGSALASHLLPIELETNECTVNGFISDLQYTAKSMLCIFFVNGRLVDCKPLQRAISQVYSNNVAKINNFVYLDLQINPENVDVNTHPTKQMVTFLFQDEIIEDIAQKVNQKLKSLDKARSFATQTILTSTVTLPEEVTATVTTSSQRYEHKLVRTDPSQSILAFTKSSPRTSQPAQLSPRKSQRLENLKQEESSEPEPELEPEQDPQDLLEPTEVRLSSVSELRKEVNAKFSAATTDFFAKHTYIGLVDSDRCLAAIQHDVRLYLADYSMISKALFYQIGLLDFANFGTIHLGDGLSIDKLLELAGNEDPISPMLEEMAPMLEDYFKIKIENRGGPIITQMPLLIPGYTPSMARLPEFITSLNQVSWTNERECLKQILEAISSWCVPVNPSNKELELVFSSLKANFVGSISLQEALVEITSLPALYRVFERC